MSLPDTIALSGGLNLTKVYTPGDGVTRRTGVDADGNQVDLVTIQSPPSKAGRTRHVARFTVTGVADATGFQKSVTLTLTFDHSSKDTRYSYIAGLTSSLLAAMPVATNMTYLVQGQQ